MPTLTHLLAPQIAKKVQEVQAAIGPEPQFSLATRLQAVRNQHPEAAASLPPINPKPAPAPAAAPAPAPAAKQGYLKTIASPADAAASSAIDAIGSLQAADPKGQGGLQAFAHGFYRGANKPMPQTIPNVQGVDTAIAYDEAGRPIYGSDPLAQRDRRGRVVLQAPSDAPIGVSESGQAVDKRGKKVGYLEQPNVRGTDRTGADVSMQDTDEFGYKTLEKMYGEHLKAMEDNRDRDGLPTDKFPADYFKGMKPDIAKNIKQGVIALRKLRKRVMTDVQMPDGNVVGYLTAGPST